MAVSPVRPVIENWTARSGFRTTVPSMARPVSVGIPATPMSPEMEMAKRYEVRFSRAAAAPERPVPPVPWVDVGAGVGSGVGSGVGVAVGVGAGVGGGVGVGGADAPPQGARASAPGLVSRAAPARANRPAEAFALVPPGDPTPVELADGRALGRSDAPATLDVWEDYQCPGCAVYSTAMEPRLIREYVAPGRLRIVFRDFAFLGQESLDPAPRRRRRGGGGRGVGRARTPAPAARVDRTGHRGRARRGAGPRGHRRGD